MLPISDIPSPSIRQMELSASLKEVGGNQGFRRSKSNTWPPQLLLVPSEMRSITSQFIRHRTGATKRRPFDPGAIFTGHHFNQE